MKTMINKTTLNYNGKSVVAKITGSGDKCIIFLHGSSSSSDNWIFQLDSKHLNEYFKLIAIDLPGHGESEWASDTTVYKLSRLGSIIQELLNKLNIENYILVGISSGTNIIGEIVPPLDGCVGIMLVSPCIVNEAFPAADILTPGDNAHVITADNPTDVELNGFIFQHCKNKDVAERFIKCYRSTDPKFREALGKGLMEGDLTDELENIKNWDVPVCVVFGKNDTLIKTHYLNSYPALWKQKVFLIENAGHVLNEEQPEAFNDLLFSFAEEMFK